MSTKREELYSFLFLLYNQQKRIKKFGFALTEDQLFEAIQQINKNAHFVVKFNLALRCYNINLAMSKGQYGFISGSIASATLQPLQNVKMVLLVPPKDIVFTSNFLKNIPISFRYLYNDGKIKAFYRGLTANVTRTGFSSAIYFSMLRHCEQFYQQFVGLKDSMLISFLSSTNARILSAVASNPLSVLETRYQYAGHERWSGSLAKNMMKIYQHQGFKGFFKGGLTTCYKQGTFAGLYYTLYQQGKSLGINNFVAGILSGMICTSITHPFEIVRAQIQSYIITEHGISNQSIFKQIQTLVRTGEAFRGLAPRVIKKPLTNTMAFCIFQLLESFDKKQ